MAAGWPDQGKSVHRWGKVKEKSTSHYSAFLLFTEAPRGGWGVFVGAGRRRCPGGAKACERQKMCTCAL